MKSFRVSSFESEGAAISSELSSPLARQPVKIGSFIPSTRPFAGGGWKPVINGKVQISTESAVGGKSEEAAMQPAAAASDPKHQSVENVSTSSGATSTSEAKKEGSESDDESRRVEPISCKNYGSTSSMGGVVASHQSGHLPASRKRSGPSADKEEHKRIKRLLRNRVSAQQARERKKAYVSVLEVRSRELELKNAELEERASTLMKENTMLRQIVRNTTIKNARGSHNMDN